MTGLGVPGRSCHMLELRFTLGRGGVRGWKPLLRIRCRDSLLSRLLVEFDLEGFEVYYHVSYEVFGALSGEDDF